MNLLDTSLQLKDSEKVFTKYEHDKSSILVRMLLWKVFLLQKDTKSNLLFLFVSGMEIMKIEAYLTSRIYTTASKSMSFGMSSFI